MNDDGVKLFFIVSFIFCKSAIDYIFNKIRLFVTCGGW